MIWGIWILIYNKKDHGKNRGVRFRGRPGGQEKTDGSGSVVQKDHGVRFRGSFQRMF